MSRLQRSSVSFRRQGSSGRIWDDPLRGLDLKALSTTTTPKAAALHPDASVVLAGDPSPRVVSRSLMRHGGGAASAGVIAESPEMVASASPAAAAALHPGALAGDPSPRVVSRSLMCHGGGGGACVIAESPEVVASSASPAAASVIVRADGEHHQEQERPARWRRRISDAFCACMGHPPASHAQQ